MQLWRSLMTVVLLGCVLVAPVVAMDMVMCFGADGHITLEPARNGRCGPSTWSASAVPQTEIQISTTTHCGPCVDVPWLTGDTREQPLPLATVSAQPSSPVLTLAIDSVPLPLALVPVPLLSASAPALSPSLMALRTTVLRI